MKHSFYDKNGKLFVDCSECKRGGNGDKSCGAGWTVKRGGHSGCFLGALRDGIPMQRSESK